MTRRKGSYRSLRSLQRDNRVCRACAEAGFPLESLPVFEGEPGQRAMIVGQAPGMVEGQERRPWRGRAGQTLRRWLELDEEEFYRTFYCASTTRCYPGRSPAGRGDRAATPREIELCRFWLDWELRLLRPALIVPVGGLGLRSILRRTNLTECVGCRFELGETTVVPLPHPSGASGWLNERANRDRLALALELVQDAVGLVRAEAAASRTRTT
jgi:uracil-DNA glycosylase